MKKPTVIDLFCGAGGLSKGFIDAGFSVVWANDVKKTFLETYKKNHPCTAVVCGDIKKIPSEKIKKDIGALKADVVIGGPPCQGFSAAGMRLIDDPRNALFREFVRVVKDLSPSWVVLENVWNLPIINGGKARKMIIDAFKEIGYRVGDGVLLAADYGVPQMRKRCFFIGTKTKNRIEFPGPTYPPGKLFKKHEMIRYKTVRDAIRDLPPIENGESHPEIPSHTVTKLNGLNLERITHVPEGGYAPNIPKRIRPKESKRGGYFYDWYRRLSWDLPSRTIIGSDKLFHPEQDRKLSLREAARLQSFGDDYTFTGPLRQQYLQVGNAVPPKMAKAVAKAIMKKIRGGRPSHSAHMSNQRR